VEVPVTRPSITRLPALDRRRFLLAAGGSAVGLAFTVQRPAHATALSTRKVGYPFTLGVASGDPLPDGVVLWTRVAPEPLAPSGGLDGDHPIPVAWQVATDPSFTRVVRSGAALASPQYAFSVHVDVRGLQPGTTYWYRFSCGGHTSEPARTSTAPLPGTAHDLRFAFASCMNYRAGYFQTMQDLAAQDLDAVFFLGDYIYEYPVQQLTTGRRLPADLPSEVVPETRTLEQYRLRYALYNSQPEVIAAHRYVPWVMMWDDHEVYNDYEATTEEQILRQAAAYRAYWEHMPLRLPQLPQGRDARLYRRLSYGDLAQFDLLDARQYRSPQLTPATIADSPARRDPVRSILGDEQEQWFTDGLRNSRARWNIAPQGVLMALVNTRNSADPDLPPTYSAGNWDGYQASQKRVFDTVASARQAGTVDNFVVLTGDVHCGYVSELPSNLDEPTSAPIGTEFTSLSVTSAQDFNPSANEARQIRTVVNPQMKWADLHCGYVIGDLSRDGLQFDYRAVDRVSRPDDPVYSLQRFVVESGEPRVHKA